MDSEVVNNKDKEYRKVYGHLLLDVAENNMLKQDNLVTHLAKKTSTLKKRIDNIINPKKKNTKAFTVSLYMAISLVMIVIFLSITTVVDAIQSFYHSSYVISSVSSKYKYDNKDLIFERAIAYKLNNNTYSGNIPVSNGLMILIKGKFSDDTLNEGTELVVDIILDDRYLEPKGMYMGYLVSNNNILSKPIKLIPLLSKVSLKFIINDTGYYNLYLFSSSVDVCYIKDINIIY